MWRKGEAQKEFEGTAKCTEREEETRQPLRRSHVPICIYAPILAATKEFLVIIMCNFRPMRDARERIIRANKYSRELGNVNIGPRYESIARFADIGAHESY